MEIIGDRHYGGSVGETLTFTLDGSDQVARVELVGERARSLPCDIECRGHKSLAVVVAFTGDSGGSAIVQVTGSGGGEDTTKIRQIDRLGSRTVLFVIDERP